MRTYRAQVINGKFTETIVNETNTGSTWPFGGTPGFSRFLDGRFVYSALYLPCLNSSQVSQLTRLGYEIAKANSSMPWIAYNTTSPSTVLEHDLFAQGCIAMSDFFFDAGLKSYLHMGNFDGNLTGMSNRQSSAIASFAGPPLLRTLHNYGNFSFERTQEVYRNISLSLTNYMRATPNIGGGNATLEASYLGGGGRPAVGVASVNKTCLRVVWPWLTLPGLLAIATLMFIVAVRFGAARRLGPEASSWRSSPLPLIFAGPSTSGKNQSDEVDSLNAPTAYSRALWSNRGEATTTGQHRKDMELAAQTMTVRLRRDEDNSLVLRRE
jgi:hypothetical protein